MPPENAGAGEFEYAAKVVPFMAATRSTIGNAIGEPPGTLIIALPQSVIDHREFTTALPDLLGGLDSGQYQIEIMQGGGFLIQFFVLTGGRIEVALRSGTQQTFNPKSVHNISTDEISTDQDG